MFLKQYAQGATITVTVMFKVLGTTLPLMNWNIKRPVKLPAQRYGEIVFCNIV